MKRTFTIIALFISAMAFAQSGTIRGTIIDAEYGEPMIGANVVIDGTTNGTITDLDGKFTIGDLEPGSYTVAISFISYETKKVAGIEVTESGVAALGEILLGQAMLETSEVVVEAKAIKNTESSVMVMQKKASNTIDGISSQTFSKTGDNDVGSAMQRVTGVSVEGGKYVYVRGLGDRYSRTLLNGASIPGLDPERNTVQMDLFPTNLIDNIIVYKNFSPDLPGDFSGGLVNINTKDFPDRFTLQANVGVGFNTNTTFQNNFLSSKTGKTDWLGFDNGKRAVPQEIVDGQFEDPVTGTLTPTFDRALVSNQAGENLEAASRQFDTDMEPTRQTAPMNHNFALAVGNQKKIGKIPFGYIANVTYNRSFSQYRNGRLGLYKLTGPVANTNTLNPEVDFSNHNSQDNVLWGAMFNGSLKLNNLNKIGITLMRNQSGLHSVNNWVGSRFKDDPDLVFESRGIAYESKSLSTVQLQGNHALKSNEKIEFHWMHSFTLSQLSQPDMRMFNSSYRFDNNGNRIYGIEPSIYTPPIRLWRDMNETNYNGQFNVVVPYSGVGGHPARVKTGLYYENRNRDFREPYRYLIQNQTSFEDYNGDVNDYMTNYWTPSESGNGGIYIQDVRQDRNTYFADLHLASGYVMTELPLTATLKLNTGVRLEQTFLNFTSQSRILQQTLGLRESQLLNTTDLLPSFNFTYNLTEKMNLRWGWNRTLARPSFRELAPFGNISPDDIITIGNPDLVRTVIDNVDVRWEWFFGMGEVISASAFFKNFQNPIERVINPEAANLEITWENVDNARLAGAEIEFRKNFGFLSEKLTGLVFGTNFTAVYSRVGIDADELAAIRALNPEASSTRVMFGQSPFIVNTFLSYKHVDKGIQANLNFNVQGQRLAVVMPDGTPHVYEMPRPNLGFNISKSWVKGYSLKFSAGNLLNSTFRQVQNYKGTEYRVNTFKQGLDFGLTFSYKIL